MRSPKFPGRRQTTWQSLVHGGIRRNLQVKSLTRTNSAVAIGEAPKILTRCLESVRSEISWPESTRRKGNYTSTVSGRRTTIPRVDEWVSSCDSCPVVGRVAKRFCLVPNPTVTCGVTTCPRWLSRRPFPRLLEALVLTSAFRHRSGCSQCATAGIVCTWPEQRKRSVFLSSTAHCSGKTAESQLSQQ